MWASRKMSSAICVTCRVWSGVRSGDLVAKGVSLDSVMLSKPDASEGALQRFPHRPSRSHAPRGSEPRALRKVSGDLAVLTSCKKLTSLDLSKTNVAGDVKALGNAVGLKHLSLSNTKVEGDIKALQNATGLFHLNLENTNVSGYMASLREAKGLLDHNVEISGTRIAGARCLLAQACSRKLCHL